MIFLILHQRIEPPACSLAYDCLNRAQYIMTERAVFPSIFFKERLRLLEDYARRRISVKLFPVEVFAVEYYVFSVFAGRSNLDSLCDEHNAVSQAYAFGAIDRRDHSGIAEENRLSFSCAHSSSPSIAQSSPNSCPLRIAYALSICSCVASFSASLSVLLVVRLDLTGRLCARFSI